MAAEETFEHHSYDVVVIGAGGAGLRAAIAAQEAGARTALICRSLLGKAHTVMAEGGIAAALGNVWPEDNWQVHFRDTMRGGKLLNHWRMADFTPRRRPSAFTSSSNGVPFLTGLRAARSASATSAATVTPVSRTSGTVPAWR